MSRFSFCFAILSFTAAVYIPQEICPNNEEYLPCGSSCQQNCSDPNPANCTAEECTEGCFCIQGYKRNETGTCVNATQCEICPTNEEYLQCGSSCQQNCSDPNPANCTAEECTEGCFCIQGYKRNETGNCVNATQCEICPTNEEYLQCGSSCQQNCSDPNPANCTAEECTEGCFCIQGYKRNETGTCVNATQCEICPNNEEYLQRGSLCQQNCSDPNPANCTAEECTEGCFCIQGYKRNETGTCVNATQCEICPNNEEYLQCGSSCQQNCSDPNPANCTAEECTEGCFCIQGYKRNVNGTCVNATQCEICPNNEEYLQCGSLCRQNCSDPNPANCTAEQCTEGCFCIQGYKRNENGTCVNATQCENCPTNEEYLLCGSSCQQNCSDPNPTNCTAEECTEGCFCIQGYKRNENGTCVNATQCGGGANMGSVSPVTLPCGENEEMLPCGTACPATCAVPEPEVCGLVCSNGCFCIEGFYMDEVTGKCVTIDNCSTVRVDMCFNANEVFDMCNATCEPTCAAPEPVCAKLCKSGCVCAPGLLRSADGRCVSVDKCPASNGTKPDVLNKYLTTINKILHLTAN